MTHTREEVLEWLVEMEAGLVDLGDDNMGLAAAAIPLIEQVTAPPTDDQLSPHFTLSELTWSDTANAEGIPNVPDAAAHAELQQLAMVTLEGIRSILGDESMQITSGYRGPELNEYIGGATNSAHLYGAAADFVVMGITPLEICRAIEPHLVELQIDQLIHENESWVHVGRAPAGGQPRYECLTIDGGHTVTGIV